MRKHICLHILTIAFLFTSFNISSQHTIAREWNEVLLNAIRGDQARPTIHARNLWHSSAMMYDIWTIFQDEAKPYFLGNTINGYNIPFSEFDTSGDSEAKLDEAISYAMFTLLIHRFKNSPSAFNTVIMIDDKMTELGYDINFTSEDYSEGNAAALGIYIGNQIIAYGLQDGSRELTKYDNAYYESINPPLQVEDPGAPNLLFPNNWQKLALDLFIDQSGNVIQDVPDFLSPEWGNVDPFSFTGDDKTTYIKNGTDQYNVYLDPGPPPFIDLNSPAEESYEYIRGFELVLKWSSHLDPSDGVMIDISPASNGNNPPLPESVDELLDYYDYENGGDFSEGHELNPVTGAPYEVQEVPFGDYTRVLAEFWADGPDSETPPGHWFSIVNYVNDHPLNTKQYGGTGEIYNDLEWDIKTYFMLGGAMHDAAVSAWSVKGYYDYIRPVSAIRYIANLGQRSDENLPSYSPYGFELVEDFVELVYEDDPLVGNNMEHLHKLKAKVWRGPDYIGSPANQTADVGWILIENWWPYQRPTFVTPPFAGYVSGHSTFSRAAAEILTKLTGSAYFPGGMGEFDVEQNEFLVFENGPSQSFTLQWATYRDASDETSLSRIWGGIHPPADDIPSRIMGIKIAEKVFEKAESYFFEDQDQDGYYSYEDCNDLDESINPGSTEICDNKDNNCNDEIDEDLPLFTYYLDNDQDGFGVTENFIETCSNIPPDGYASFNEDCDDENEFINPSSDEVCDDIDNNCNNEVDENLELFTYFIDNDNDGFGNSNDFIEVCLSETPVGYSKIGDDCDDGNEFINPSSAEQCDNIDNNCDGLIDEGLTLFTYYEDSDNDSFGDPNNEIILCNVAAPAGFVDNNWDCNDSNSDIFPTAVEISDNGIDEDCNGVDLFEITKIYPNPFTNELTIHLNHQGSARFILINSLGQHVYEREIVGQNNVFYLNNIPAESKGLYYLYIIDQQGELLYEEKLIAL